MNYKNRKINCSSIREKQGNEYQEYARARREKVFSIFTNNTNSKNYTVTVASAFLDSYLPGLITHLSCNIVDLGTGNGYLSQQVAEYMHGKCVNKIITYEGIETRENFVNETKIRLRTLDYVDGKIIQGNCFGGKIDELANKSVLLIASHVIYYRGNLTISELIDKIFKKMALVSIIIAQAEGSVLNKVIKAYAGHEGTEAPVEEAISAHNFSHIKILYSSLIYFPNDITYQKLINLAQADFEQLEGKDLEIRGLLEFSAGLSIEELFCSNEEKLAHLIGDIYTNIALNSGNIKFWNYAQITVPKDKMSQEGMKLQMDKINNLALSGNITSFKSAIQGGDYEIAIALHKQGFMISHNYSYSFVNEALSIIKSYIRYELKLSAGWPELFRYFYIDLDERIKFRNYSSPEILRMQNIKYNYSVIYGLPNPVLKVNNLVKSEGSLFREWITKGKWSILASLVSYPLIYEFSTSSILLASSYLIIPSDLTKNGLSLGMIMVYNSFWKKFFYTSNSAIHYIKGDDFLFQLYLYDETNLDSLKFKNSEGQTALHKAILNKDIDKINILLSCSDSLNIVNIQDSKGKLPLHNAIEAGINDEVIKILIERSTNLNFEVTSIIADFFLFGGKFIYFYSYFTAWVKKQHPYQIIESYIRLAALTGIYTLTNYFDMNLLDKIYYFTFAHRLNYYENWEIKSNHLQYKYNHDTPLHLSTKYNREEITKYLLTKNNTKVNALNIKGESALHLAAANNNIKLIDLLLEHGAEINLQANIFNNLYLLGDFIIKAFTLYYDTNNLLAIYSEAIFIIVIRNEIFGLFYPISSPTPLHYAVMNSSKEAIIKLIENGADPDLTMSYYSNPYLQIIPYVATKLLSLMISTILKKDISAFYKFPILVIFQTAFFYSEKALKPLELINNTQLETHNQSIYQYLKQYTALNKDTDEIHMKKYGIYKGGNGRDIFHIYKLEESSKYRMIIKNYNVNEDALLFHNCNNITKKIEIINTHQAITLYSNDDMLVTLLDVSTINIEEIL